MPEIGTVRLTIQIRWPFIKIGFEKNPEFFNNPFLKLGTVPLGTTLLRLSASFPFLRWEKNKDFDREVFG